MALSPAGLRMEGLSHYSVKPDGGKFMVLGLYHTVNISSAYLNQTSGGDGWIMGLLECSDSLECNITAC